MQKFRLTKEEQDSLLDAIKEGYDNPVDEKLKLRAIRAEKKLISESKHVMKGVVRHYAGRSGLGEDELLKLTEKGLKEAIKRWHWEKNRKYRFIVYAMWFMRAEIHKKLGLPIK